MHGILGSLISGIVCPHIGGERNGRAKYWFMQDIPEFGLHLLAFKNIGSALNFVQEVHLL